MSQKPNFNRTKIVATLGPASANKETIKNLFLEGVDVFRINFSHGEYKDHLNLLHSIKAVNHEHLTKSSILGDLQGPKIRIGLVKNGKRKLHAGDEIEICTDEFLGTSKRLSINYQQFPKDVKSGEMILMDDGKIQLEVVSTNEKDAVIARVIYGGQISSNKGVNLPNTALSTPALTEKDIRDLKFICENDFDWVALSFVQSADDIRDLRRRIWEAGADLRVIAKIEKPQAVENIEEIFEVSDAVMVARGDLGVEIPIEYLPMTQKKIVKLGKKYSKPVIIATQLMESMVTAFMPTRAEAVDVANAVMEGADAVMLSGETSIGNHPIKVIESMVKIITSIEKEKSIYTGALRPTRDAELFYNDSICWIAVQSAKHVDATAIIAMTQSGYTAQKIASFRPEAPIFVFTSNRKLLTQINLYWGARAFFYDKFRSTDETIQDIKLFLKEKGYVKPGEVIINTASMPLHEKRRTNMIKLTTVD